MHPLELSVGDEQLVLTATAAAAAARGLEELATALFRQVLCHYVNVWEVIKITGESVSIITVATGI